MHVENRINKGTFHLRKTFSLCGVSIYDVILPNYAYKYDLCTLWCLYSCLSHSITIEVVSANSYLVSKLYVQSNSVVDQRFTKLFTQLKRN